MRLGQVLEARDMKLEGGIVHQHIQPAQLLDRALDRLAAKAALGDIARDQDAAAAFGLHRFAGA